MIKVTNEELDKIKSILIQENAKNVYWQAPNEADILHEHFAKLQTIIERSRSFNKITLLVLRDPKHISWGLSTDTTIKPKCLFLSSSRLLLQPPTASAWAQICLCYRSQEEFWKERVHRMQKNML